MMDSSYPIYHCTTNNNARAYFISSRCILQYLKQIVEKIYFKNVID